METRFFNEEQAGWIKEELAAILKTGSYLSFEKMVGVLVKCLNRADGYESHTILGFHRSIHRSSGWHVAVIDFPLSIRTCSDIYITSGNDDEFFAEVWRTRSQEEQVEMLLAYMARLVNSMKEV